MPPKTLYQKICDHHVVWEDPGQRALIYIDRHLIHEGTSPQAFAGLRAESRKVRRPDLTFAVMDHSVPTTDRTLPILDSDFTYQSVSRRCLRYSADQPEHRLCPPRPAETKSAPRFLPGK